MDEFSKELEELGHVKVPHGRCTARYKMAPQNVDGPRGIPVWCDLPAGHEGPHRHVSGHRSFIMDRESLIEMVPLPEVCRECGTTWPCKEAEKLTKALAIGEARGLVLGMEEAAGIAENAAKESQCHAMLHPENTASRDRCFARSREASGIAATIRQAAQGGDQKANLRPKTPSNEHDNNTLGKGTAWDQAAQGANHEQAE